MRRAELLDAIASHGNMHQVFRIIQLDRRSGKAHVPASTIAWTATVELIIKGSNTKIRELPLS